MHDKDMIDQSNKVTISPLKIISKLTKKYVKITIDEKFAKVCIHSLRFDEFYFCEFEFFI